MKYSISCSRHECGLLGSTDDQVVAQILADTHNTRRGHHLAQVSPKADVTNPVTTPTTGATDGGAR